MELSEVRGRLVGIGVDGDTALVAEGTEFRVIGSGAVTVIDGGAMTYTNLPYAEESHPPALHGVVGHALTEGRSFNLANRLPVIENATRKRNGTSDSGGAKKPAKGNGGRSHGE